MGCCSRRYHTAAAFGPSLRAACTAHPLRGRGPAAGASWPKPVFAQDAALRIALQGVPRHRLGESVDVSSKLGRVGRAAERNAVELVLHVRQRTFVVLLRLRAVLLGPRPLVPCPRAQRLGSVPHVRVLGQQVDRSAILASGKRLALPR